MVSALLPIEHQVMVSEISRLPTWDIEQKWSAPLKRLHHHCRAKMAWIGERLNYLQATQAGFRVIDPVAEATELHCRQKEELVAYSDYYFHFLHLLVGDPTGGLNGFDLARDKAREVMRDFPFQSPRELVSKAVRWAVDEGFNEVVNSAVEGGISETRDALRLEAKILRNRDPKNSASYTASKPEQAKFQRDCLDYWEESKYSENWFRFVFFACRPYVNRKSLKPFWDDMLRSHKQLTAFYTAQTVDNAVAVVPMWRNGLPFDRNGSPVKY